jgi:predicted transcriptional regulator
MDIARSIEIIKSLADTSRLRVLNALIEKPQYVEELAHRLNLAASTVSFHLKKLETAGLIEQRKEQYYIIYGINERLFNLTLQDLVKCEDLEKYSQAERMEKYRRKVLNSFFRKNRLIKLPVQRKKRMIVLEEFSGKFREGKKYKEEDVNGLIKETYDDYCMIRRLLIEEGIMRREKQIYWIVEKNEKESK